MDLGAEDGRESRIGTKSGGKLVGLSKAEMLIGGS